MKPMLSRISVVVCTHNRAECINTALQSLQRQTLPSNFYEILLVDNASTDNTYQEVRRWAATTPNLRYVCEHRLGLSFARNTGALLSTTPYIAYMDDDAYADPQWLESIVEAFENSKKFIGVVGGRVWLDWGGAPPSWLPQQYWSLYTYLDQGNQGHFLSPGEYLVGANMAFHRATLLDQGGFATYLGRKGRNLLSGEESALLQRLRLQN
ncbi:MAG: glycosyl transferase family 2, partial [Nitrospiraceae bacterium]